MAVIAGLDHPMVTLLLSPEETGLLLGHLHLTRFPDRTGVSGEKGGPRQSP